MFHAQLLKDTKIQGSFYAYQDALRWAGTLSIRQNGPVRIYKTLKGRIVLGKEITINNTI